MMKNTSIVDFARQDDGAAQLIRAVPKVDAESENTLLWDIDLAFGLSSPDDAEYLDATIPSTGELQGRAKEGLGSAVVTVKPTADTIKITMNTENGRVFLDGVSAEVRHLQVRTTERVQTYLARLRLRAVKATDSVGLLEALGKKIGVVVEPRQADLPFNKTGDSPDPEIGSVVAGKIGDEDVFGIFTGKKGDKYTLVDFGIVRRADSIVSAVKVEGADDKENALLKDYENHAKELGSAPTWANLVVALGQQVGKGKGKKKVTGWTLSQDVVNAAIDMHLPEEAGDKQAIA
jgi:hypothetical protein